MIEDDNNEDDPMFTELLNALDRASAKCGGGNLTREGWQGMELPAEVRQACNAYAIIYAGLRQEGFTNEEAFALLVTQIQASR